MAKVPSTERSSSKRVDFLSSTSLVVVHASGSSGGGGGALSDCDTRGYEIITLVVASHPHDNTSYCW